MSGTVKALMFGSACECQAAAQALSAWSLSSGYDCESSWVDDLEEFEKALVDWEPTLLVVLADGAVGMECVYRCRERSRNLPVFWFSDDRGFGIQSYRLNCAYFSTKPITPDKLIQAIHRCEHCGIAFCTG